MIRREVRAAARQHRCGSCLGPIAKGERHLVYVTSPGHDGWAPDAWTTFRECAVCCERYGRSLAVAS